jgi:hypothetical protein
MSGINVSPPFPLLHCAHTPNCVQIGGHGEGGTVRVESSTLWSEQIRQQMRAKYNVVGDLDEYFHLPFQIEAGDTPVVICMINSDVSYLDMCLRFIDTSVNKKVN